MKKKCSNCKQDKSITDFYRSMHYTQSYCMDCCKKKKKDNYKAPDEWMTIFCGEGNWMRYYLWVD